MTELSKPSKSQLTRDRILAAARELFAARGYERATVRDIAQKAAINPSMVIRYFGSKQALFAEASPLDLEIGLLVSKNRDEVGHDLVSHLLDRWEDPQIGPQLAALVRAAVSQNEARERLAAVFEGQLQTLVKALGTKGDANEAVGLISAELLGLAFGRYVLQLPSITGLSRKRLVKRVGGTIQRYLDK
ncbi:MAG: TetR family transcriptional regulator [Caulobacteraceae bacterium]|nr:TetR family transcriptional regulator [Caulobacteraceae bacterium]